MYLSYVEHGITHRRGRLLMRLLFGLSILCSIACSSTLPEVPSQPVELTSISESTLLVNELLDESLEAAFMASPISASMRGHREYDRQFPT